jgi:hypothetical protein
MEGRGRKPDNIFVEQLWRNAKHNDINQNGHAAVLFYLIILNLLRLIIYKPHHKCARAIDGITQMTYNEFRRNGKYDLVISNLKRILEINKNVKF